jgi:D-3-phosphoglycerate dehydrogenase / 2-oxoglutarate reductase
MSVSTPQMPAPAADLGRPRVLVLDPIRDVPWDYDVERAVLARAGARLVVPEVEDEVDELARGADAIIVTGLRRLESELIASLDRTVGIVCYSTGMDAVDLPAARAAGLAVRNVPGYCTDEVADHALALLLAAWRRLPRLSARAAAHDWAVHDDPEFRAIRRLRGRTAGILGAGRIGRAVAARARAFGLVTIAADPLVTDAGEGLPVVRIEELLTRADALVLCAPLTPETRGIVGRDALARVRPGLVLVNVARGGLVDEQALAEALRDGRVAAAALDVRDPEPPRPEDDPLADLPGVLQTPHVAGASQEARLDLQRMAAETCLELLAENGRLAR